MKQVGAAVRATDRQLGRKADWHLGRIGRLLEEIEPIPQRQWQGALRAARNENLTVVLGRLGEDSPGLLALLHLFKPYRPETRKVLAELSEILADNSELRKLAKAGEKRFEGAAVVVDELLPRRTKSTTRQRWVDADFSGRDDLRAILEAFASSDHAAVLGKLLNPQAAARMERLIRFYAGELPDLRPERQQLDALRGISDVMRRVKLVHKGIQALLGTRDEVRGLVIGQLISQAFAAQKSIDAFNRLGPRLERIEEPWAKALALWVASVFAERVWYGVEHDEAALKMWETLAERGKELGRAIDERIEELRSMGLESAADFLSIERARLKAAISDIDQMLAKMDEIRTTDDQFEGLAEALKEFKELAADRGVAISDLLETYRPEARRIPDEQGLVEHTTNLLRSIEDPWPASGSEDLREYLRRLRAFAEQSHADRLRGRLAEVVGLSLISKGVVLDKDDVAEIEEGWPKLSQEFAGACRDAIEMTPQAGSEKLRVWVNEALDKQSCLAEWPGLDAPRFASLDIKVREWATRVTVRPSQVAEAGAFRSRAQQLLTNLSRCVAPTVIDELLNVAEGAAAGEAYATLEREMQEFQREVEALAQSFREVVGPSALRWPYPGATRAAVCAELDASRRTAEDKREELHHRIQSLNGVIEQLGGRPRLIPSPPTVPDAQNIAATALAEAAGLLDSAWRTLFERLRHLGFDSVFSGRVTGSAPEEDQSSLDTARRWCGLVEEEARALEAMGLHFPEVTDKTPEAALEDFRLAVAQGEVELRNANERVRMLRSRLERLGCEDETSDVSPFTMLGDAKEAQRQLEAAIEEVRTRRLGKASEDAQRVYRALLAGDETHYGDVPPSIRELRRLGLLCTIEDNE